MPEHVGVEEITVVDKQPVQQCCARCGHGMYLFPVEGKGDLLCEVFIPFWASGNPRVQELDGKSCKLFVLRIGN